MTSSFDRKNLRPPSQGGPFPNLGLPDGPKPASLSRFIPGEELGHFKAWQPGALTGSDRRSHEERRQEARGTTDRRSGGDSDTPNKPSSSNAASSATSSTTTAPPTKPPAGPSVAEWQTRVTAARQAGYQDGYRDGLVALENFKQTFAHQHAAQIGALLQAFDEQLQALDGEMAQSLARTALQLAQQVLRVELKQRPEVVAEVARLAVAGVMHSARQITVHVHPQDLQLVQLGAEEALSARGARLQVDSTLQRGGVRVNSDVGSVDARIELRWAEAAAALGAHPPATEGPVAASAAQAGAR